VLTSNTKTRLSALFSFGFECQRAKGDNSKAKKEEAQSPERAQTIAKYLTRTCRKTAERAPNGSLDRRQPPLFQAHPQHRSIHNFDTVRTAFYARVSTANNGQDPTIQTRELEDYCERRG